MSHRLHLLVFVSKPRANGHHGESSLLLSMLLCLLLTLSAEAAAPLPPFNVTSNLPPEIVVNPDQGLGQCHWIEVGILSQPYVSWGYDASETVSGWAAVEPQPGSFTWAPLDAQVQKASDLGKRIWLELLTTEGQTPQWAREAGVVLVGSRGGTPVPWNEAYQTLLRRAVHAMAARYDDDPTVDAINVMAGGCYGEMAICARETDTATWEQAGYTDDKFIAAAKQIIDIYLEEEHLWEDGTKTHGFRKTPVVLQLGGGLYGHTVAVIQPVVDYAMAKYGMRVWLKYNGLGGDHDMDWLYKQYSDVTRVGYEPAGTNPALQDDPKAYVQAALEQHASYLCLQKSYYALDEPQWLEAREMAARYLGAQIALLDVEAAPSVSAGQQVTLTTSWMNRGTVPLMRPVRQGFRDFPASYDIWVGLLDPATGAVVFERSFTPSVPTTEWYSAQAVRIDATLPVPAALPAGAYELRIGLLNPGLPAEEPARYFRLLNTSLDDESGRYRAGRVEVGHPAPVVTLTPAPSPSNPSTPPQAESWLAQFLRRLWEWLHDLFR